MFFFRLKMTELLVDIENDQLWNLKSLDNSMPSVVLLEYDQNLDKNEIKVHKNIDKN